MAIWQLEVSGFRNFRSLTISPSPAFNWIVGANGAGKTSLLEAIHFLATTKSFRTRVPRQYIHRDMSECVVFGRVEQSVDSSLAVERLAVGVRRGISGSPECRLNGISFTKLSELAKLFPVVTLAPDSVEIIEGDPSNRREFLDWTMFHVEHSQGAAYLDVYRQYERSLDQRNRLLRELGRRDRTSDAKRRATTSSGALASWDAQLIRWGEELDLRRKNFIETHFRHFDLSLEVDDAALPEVPKNDIKPQIQQVSRSLAHGNSDPESVLVSYQQGWPSGIGYQDALRSATEKDLERGSTSVGPHRADLRLTSGGLSVKEHFSRGQKKHLVAMLKLRQLELFVATHARRNVLFLGDDVFSELDERHASHVFRRLRHLGVQCFATTIETPENKGFFDPVHDRMFHVEHGALVHHCLPPSPNVSELSE